MIKKVMIIVVAMMFLFSTGCDEQIAKGTEKTQTEDKTKTVKKVDKVEEAAPVDSKLLEPAKAIEKAPNTYKVKLETTKGDVVIEVTRSWAPNGADRFYNLVKVGFFNDIAFFRVIDNFMVQCGIHGNPDVSKAWKSAKIKDDKDNKSNKRSFVTFATGGPNTRTTQFFINFKDNSFLDSQGFPPFGKVIEGMENVDSLYKGYGEGAPRGRGPGQGRIQSEGNSYLKKDFPDMDYIVKASIVE